MCSAAGSGGNDQAPRTIDLVPAAAFVLRPPKSQTCKDNKCSPSETVKPGKNSDLEIFVFFNILLQSPPVGTNRLRTWLARQWELHYPSTGTVLEVSMNVNKP